MLVYEGAGLLVLLALWLFCLIDVIMCDEYQCRNLPKMVWLLIVLILPDVGSVLWLVAGRPVGRSQSRGLPYKVNTGRSSQAAATPTNPDDDEEFLRTVRRRAEEQRRVAREQRERDERARHKDDPDAG
jgi:hypothetical protein